MESDEKFIRNRNHIDVEITKIKMRVSLIPRKSSLSIKKRYEDQIRFRWKCRTRSVVNTTFLHDDMRLVPASCAVFGRSALWFPVSCCVDLFCGDAAVGTVNQGIRDCFCGGVECFYKANFILG
jgi:hypothetical protein